MAAVGLAKVSWLYTTILHEVNLLNKHFLVPFFSLFCLHNQVGKQKLTQIVTEGRGITTRRISTISTRTRHTCTHTTRICT